MVPTRRTFLASTGALGLTAVAGCLGSLTSGDELAESSPIGPIDDPTPVLVETGIAPDGRSIGCSDPGSPDGNSGVPTAAEDLTLLDCPSTLLDSIADGGVDQDGIPSIDDPSFVDVETADGVLDDGDPVSGIVRNGEAKAYPQHVLVWHEIVNDEIAGDPVSVTYCPLTGTAQGFERGPVEFGVSGKLLNSNLIMYDRASESYWPQMLARAIDGPETGATLQEFPVHWTTWERWSGAFPDSAVLSEETGFARNYDRDPYGSYSPRSGHYADSSLVFPGYVSDEEERLHPKTVVLGARSASGAIAIEKDALREHGVLYGPLDGVEHVAVYDPTLDTGYVYRNPAGRTVEYVDGDARVDGERYDPDEVPLDRLLRYDAMWFSWYGYYPHTTVIRRDPSAIDDGED